LWRSPHQNGDAVTDTFRQNDEGSALGSAIGVLVVSLV
jgi:hypothetical protein